MSDLAPLTCVTRSSDWLNNPYYRVYLSQVRRQLLPPTKKSISKVIYSANICMELSFVSLPLTSTFNLKEQMWSFSCKSETSSSEVHLLLSYRTRCGRRVRHRAGGESSSVQCCVTATPQYRPTTRTDQRRLPSDQDVTTPALRPRKQF